MDDDDGSHDKKGIRLQLNLTTTMSALLATVMSVTVSSAAHSYIVGWLPT